MNFLYSGPRSGGASQISIDYYLKIETRTDETERE